MSSCANRMEKISLIITILFLLCGCRNYRSFACQSFNGDDSLRIEFETVNDDIVSVHVSQLKVLPSDLLYNQKFMEDFNRQLNEEYHLEENKLIREYDLPVEGKYSITSTIRQLESERYHCE